MKILINKKEKTIFFKDYIPSEKLKIKNTISKLSSSFSLKKRNEKKMTIKQATNFY